MAPQLSRARRASAGASCCSPTRVRTGFPCDSSYSASLSATALADNPYSVTTPGKPGGAGVVPILSGSGPATPGSFNSVLMQRALANSSATLVIGLSELAAPFKGGILGPAVDWLSPGLAINANGQLLLPFELPGDAPPGFAVWLQFWVNDPGATTGLSASNSLTFAVQAPTDPLFTGVQFSFPVGAAPTALSLTDLNADDHLDMTVTNAVSEFVSVLHGLGNGTFRTAQTLDVGDGPVSLAHGDLDADDVLDLVSAHTTSSDVAVSLGLGNGTFGPPQRFATGQWPMDVTIADVDGDAVLDIITANSSGGASVLLGRGGGNFHAHEDHTVGFAPESLAVGDLDGDGELDLAVGYHGGSLGRIAVLYGTGSAAFDPKVDHPVHGAPEDVDGDGRLDICGVTQGFDEIMVLLNQGTAGSGAFAAPQAYPMNQGTDPQALAVDDLDGDDVPDIVAGHHSGVSWFLGVGDGSFCPQHALDVSDGMRFGVDVGDVNSDGAVDIVGTRFFLDEVSVLINQLPE